MTKPQRVYCLNADGSINVSEYAHKMDDYCEGLEAEFNELEPKYLAAMVREGAQAATIGKLKEALRDIANAEDYDDCSDLSRWYLDRAKAALAEAEKGEG